MALTIEIAIDFICAENTAFVFCSLTHHVNINQIQAINVWTKKKPLWHIQCLAIAFAILNTKEYGKTQHFCFLTTIQYTNGNVFGEVKITKCVDGDHTTREKK